MEPRVSRPEREAARTAAAAKAWGGMTAADLLAWQTIMNVTQQQAADLLGMHRVSFAKMLAGAAIDRRTALACAAIAAGLQPWGSKE